MDVCFGIILIALVEVKQGLAVSSAPWKPEFENTENIETCKGCIPAVLNRTTVVKCLVKGGSEPIELNMTKSGNSILDVKRSCYEQNAKRYTALSYTFTPTEEDLNTPTFTCTVKNWAMKTEAANTTKLYVKVDPETVDIEIQPVKENETAQVQCITTGGRPPERAEIYFNNKRQSNAHIISTISTGHTYSVTTSLHRSFSRFENQGRARCCSNVSRPNCSKSKPVNVTFPPLNVKLTEIKKVNEENGNAQLTLKCSIGESNPKSAIDWKGIKSLPNQQLRETYKKHRQTHGWTFSTSWVFNLTKDDNYRNIRCNVLNHEFPDLVLQDDYKPNITFSPVIEISRRWNKKIYTGDDVKLTCHVESNPPSVITWYNETDKIAESYGQQLDLHLANVSLDDSQTYSCTAINNIGGLKSRNVTLTVKDAVEKIASQPNSENTSISEVWLVICFAAVMVVSVTANIAFIIFFTVRKRKDVTAEKTEYYQNVDDESHPYDYWSAHSTGSERISNNMRASGTEMEEQKYESLLDRDDQHVYSVTKQNEGSIQEDQL